MHLSSRPEAKKPNPAEMIERMVRLYAASHGGNDQYALEQLARRHAFTVNQLRYGWKRATDWRDGFTRKVREAFLEEIEKQLTKLQVEYDLVVSLGQPGEDQDVLAGFEDDLHRLRDALALAKAQAFTHKKNKTARR